MTWRICPFLYDQHGTVAAHASTRDAEFFARHPRQTWRVRPLYDGESPLAEGMQALGYRTYCIVIDHARAGDRRASAGRAVYPVVIHDHDREAARRLLSDVARRWAKWFRKHSTTPPPLSGQAVVM